MKKKTKTKTTQVTTPTNPEFVQKPVENYLGDVDALRAIDPKTLIAGPDALQTQAAGEAAGLAGGSADLRRISGAGPQDIASLISGFQNPYTKDVVDTSLADYDFGAGQSRAQGMLDLAGDETFGGSGGSVFRSGLEGEILRGRGALSANLRSGAFDKAAGLASTQAGLNEQGLARQAAAAQALGDTERANTALRYDMGAQQRQIEQEKLQAALSLLQTRGGLIGQAPTNLFRGENSTGTTTTTTSNPMGQIGGVLAGLDSIPLTGGLSAGLMGGLGKTLGGSLLSKVAPKLMARG